MDHKKFIKFIDENKELLRNFINPSDEYVKKMRHILANKGIECTPDQVKKHMKTIEDILDKLDRKDST